MQQHRTAGVGAAIITLMALTGSAGAAATPTQAQVAAPVCRSWIAQPQTDPLAPYHFGAGALAVLSPSDIWTAGTLSNPADGAVSAQIHHWDGTTWANVPLPPYDGPLDTLEAITAVTPADIWAVGARVLHWNGSQWQTVAVPLSGGANLTAVATHGPDDMWAVGTFSTTGGNAPLTIHWNGQQWRQVALPVMQRKLVGLEAVAVISATNVWAVANSPDDQPAIVHWDGTTWSLADVALLPNTSSYLHAISALAPDDIWAAGEVEVADHKMDAFVLHWNGQTWSRSPIALFQNHTGTKRRLQVTDIKARSPQDVWLAVNQDYQSMALAHWTGTNWVQGRNPLPNGEAGRMVAAGDDLWLLGQGITPPAQISQGVLMRYSPGPCTDSRAFPQTGHTVADPLLAYWEDHGALAQQGYPLTEAHPEPSATDGKVYQTQYFERAVFEQHPENAPPYNILLSLLGVEAYTQRYGTAGAPGQQVNNDRARFFSETGHTVGGDFRLYWEAHGGLAQQGYPISEEFAERNALNGQTYTVQYFQRAVFEYHPENHGTPYVVLLSQLGRFAAQRRGLLAP